MLVNVCFGDQTVCVGRKRGVYSVNRGETEGIIWRGGEYIKKNHRGRGCIHISEITLKGGGE